MIKQRLVAATPVSGIWAVSKDDQGKQYKEKVALMLTIENIDSQAPDQPHVTFKYVTHMEVRDFGYVELSETGLYNTEMYVGLIYDETIDEELKTEDYL